MFLRLALAAALAAAIFAAAEPQPSRAESPAQAPPASPAKPDAAQPAPAAPAQATPATTGDPFGEDATLTAKPIVYLKGTGTWDNAFETITNSFKTLKAYIGKEGLKIDGEPMTIFTATDDTGFQFEAAIPVAEPPKLRPRARSASALRRKGMH